MIKIFSYFLVPGNLENQFRIELLPQNKSQMKVIIYLSLFFLFSFIFLEFYYLQEKIPFIASIISRLIVAVILSTSLFILPMIQKVKNFDRYVFFLAMTTLLHMLVVTFVRPGDNVTLVAWDIIAVIAMYTALPIQLKYQTMSALFLTIGSSAIWLFYKSPNWSIIETVATLGAYCFANIYGIYLSLKLNRTARKRFILLERERIAKKELEKAINEINVLQGIIPICASCKKVRDDKGYWKQVESYIEDHSEAQFSHSLCRDCSKKLYPGYLKGDK